MKPTIFSVIFFFSIGVITNALNITMMIIIIMLSAFLIYIAWIEDKKAKHEQELRTQRMIKIKKITDLYKRESNKIK